MTTPRAVTPTVPTDLPSPVALAKRLQQLERDNALLKAGVFVLALLALAGGTWVFMMRVRDEPLERDIVQARAMFVLHPSGGYAVQMDGRRNDETDFQIGNYGTPWARVLSDGNGVSLGLFDMKAVRAMSLNAPNRNPSASLSVGNDGARSLRLYDDGGVLRAALSYTQLGPCLDFFVAAGRPRLSIGLDQNDRPLLGSWDAFGNPVSAK